MRTEVAISQWNHLWEGKSASNQPCESSNSSLDRCGQESWGLVVLWEMANVVAMGTCLERNRTIWSGRFGQAMKSCRNLTLLQSRAVWFKAHSLHHHTVGFQRSRHSTQKRTPFMIRNSGKRCRMASAWLLCIFVAPHISLIMVVNLGSMRWALLLFKYLCSMSGLSHSCCRWPESKTIVLSKHSLDFIRSRFSRAHPLEPELLSVIRHLSIF